MKINKCFLILCGMMLTTVSYATILKAGFAAVDITPDLNRFKKVQLGGFEPNYPLPRFIYKNRLAEGVLDPIWARTVAVQNEEGKTIVLMSTDLPGLAWKYINPVRRELAKRYNIPVSNIIIAATHTHAAPDASGYWVSLQLGHNSKYNHQLMEWMIQSGSEAIESMKPAEMKILTTEHYSCFDPKTKELKKDPECNIPKNFTSYSQPGGELYDQLLIQHDKREPIVRNTKITVMHYRDPSTHETLGTFINWHNHPETHGSENKKISSDFPHFLRGYVEKHLGGTAVYFSGTLGCQIGPGVPIPFWNENEQPVYTGEIGPSGQRIRQLVSEGNMERTRSIGLEIGHEVVAAVNSDKQDYKILAPLSIKSEPMDIEPNNALHLIATGSVWKFDVELEDMMYWYIGRCMGKFGCVRSDVALIELDNLTILTGPAEIDPVFLYGREASESIWVKGKKTYRSNFKALEGTRKYMKGVHVAMLGQAQNYLSYQVHLDDNVGQLNLKHPNHYEEMVTVNKHLGDDLGNKWMQLLGSPYRYSKRRILP